MIRLKSFVSAIVSTVVVTVVSMVASLNKRDTFRTVALPFTISGWR